MEANDCLRVLSRHGKRQSVEMNASGSVTACTGAGASLLSLTDVAGGGMQVEDDVGGLDDAQVAEPRGKRYKEDNVAKDMLMRCAEDAASRATSEMNSITSQLLQDAADRDQRLEARDAALAEKVAGLMKVVSEPVDSKLDTRTAGARAMEDARKNWTDKIVQPDDKEVVITQAEHRIKRMVQRGADERWKNRMTNEDKITTNTIEVLRSDIKRLGAKTAEEVVCMKSRHQCSQHGFGIHGTWRKRG